MYITTSLLLTVIGKPLPETCLLYSIIPSAHSYPLENYISREEFTFADHYPNQLIDSLINYFYFFQFSHNTIASFTLGFLLLFTYCSLLQIHFYTWKRFIAHFNYTQKLFHVSCSYKCPLFSL